ncbi:hypothetical protein ACED51_14270 [Photobacterium swingsii]|uniref:hypothetical protein n=1 Tax=Photobacterium swingsii TaxID=680026 RepID=UPI00352BF4BE
MSNLYGMPKKKYDSLRADLSTEQVNDILSLHATGLWSQKEIAKKYNISQPTVSRIINHKWFGVEDKAQGIKVENYVPEPDVSQLTRHTVEDIDKMIADLETIKQNMINKED